MQQISQSGAQPKSQSGSQSGLRSGFENIVQRAIARPDQIDFIDLLNELEICIAELTRSETLQRAGAAIAQLAEIYVARSEYLLDQWEEAYWFDSSEPVLTEDMLADVLRHSMTLSLDGLLEESTPLTRNRINRSEETSDSVAGVVDKSAVLNLLDEMERAETQEVLAIAHDEDVSAWGQAIHGWMKRHQRGGTLCELYAALKRSDPKMSLVKVWLGLLLGEYELEQRGDFYDISSIWIIPSEVS